MILCCEIDSGFRVPKIIVIIITWLPANYLCKFLKVQWLHFAGVVDKVIITFLIFKDSIYQFLFKSVYIWLSYLEKFVFLSMVYIACNLGCFLNVILSSEPFI